MSEKPNHSSFSLWAETSCKKRKKKLHFGILCDVKLGLKAGTRYSLNVWLGNQGIKVDEWFPAELLLLNCSAVGFYPEQGPGVKLSFGILRVDVVPSMMGRAEAHHGSRMSLPLTVTVKNGFPRGSVNILGWFGVGFFSCCECSPRRIPTCCVQGKHGLAWLELWGEMSWSNPIKSTFLWGGLSSVKPFLVEQAEKSLELVMDVVALQVLLSGECQKTPGRGIGSDTSQNEVPQFGLMVFLVRKSILKS